MDRPHLDEKFETVIDDVKPWTIPEVPSRCEYALLFLDWVQENIDEEIVGKNITVLTLIIAKAILTDQYRFLRRQVNKKCRNKVSDRGHECIFHIWDQSYQRLEKIESRLPEHLTVPELEELKRLRKKVRERGPFATLAALREDDKP